MSPRTRRRTLWAAPAVAATVVAAGAVAVTGQASASDHPRLPYRTARQLLASLAHPHAEALSGTVVETARLGLPDLPGSGARASLDWQSLATGTHTVKVWQDGPQRQRLALLGQLSESDVVRNGREVWTYSSDTHRVGHTTLPVGAERRGGRLPVPGAAGLGAATPQQAADELLTALDPTTLVTVDRTTRVAGQAAYTLVLQPRQSARTTIRRVTLAVDAAHDVPLRLQVYGTAPAPAFEVGFTDVSFRRPAPAVFRFTPPKGVTVSDQLLPDGSGPDGEGPAGGGPENGSGGGRRDAAGGVRVVGAGWSAVAVLPGAGRLPGGGEGQAAVTRLFTARPDGSRVLRSALVNALATADGRLLVGAVPVGVLDEVATRGGG